MKNSLKFLLLAPFLMAVLCEPEEIICAPTQTEAYIVNVENSSETYEIGEVFWLNSETSSELINNCNDNDPEIVFDEEVFKTGFFILKLTNELENLNTTVVEDYNIIYDLGSAYSYSSCFEFISFVPELSETNLVYQYRIGISINQPGDYCIVNAFDSYFNIEQENNSDIFQPYDFIDGSIKFDSCDDTYTRNIDQEHYFFKVN